MPAHHKGPRQEVLALDTYIKLIRAAETVAEMVARPMAETGLTMAQFAVMEALYHLGPMRPTDVARKLLRSGGNITTVLDNLQREGLVERVSSVGDRRCLTVRLTRKGRALLKRVFPKHAAYIAELMSVLNSAEQRELARLARKLGVSLRSE